MNVKRLRFLEAAHEEQGNIGMSAMQEVMNALPTLLDRLEKLEAVAEVGNEMRLLSHLLGTTTGPRFQPLWNALAALEKP